MFKNLDSAALGVPGHGSDVIELALTYRFAAIEVDMKSIAQARSKGTSYAIRLIKSSKLHVSTFSLPIDWDADDDAFQKELKKLPELTECAQELGCTRCTSTLAPASDLRPYHENFETHRKRIQTVATVLQPAGIRLGIGFHAAESLRRGRAFQFIHDLDALNLLVSMVAMPNVGLLIDTWNVVASGGSVESVGKLTGQQVVAVQVADMPADVALADLDEKSRLLPSSEDGRVDNRAFLAALRQAGYEGPVTAKPSNAALAGRSREQVFKEVSETLDALMNC